MITPSVVPDIAEPANRLVQLVARHAKQFGRKTAVAKGRPGAGFVETSYAALWSQTRRLAALCGGLAAERAMVPMLVGKSAEGIAAMLAALATGRPFCFLNTKYRGPQIASVLDASAAQVCVIDAPGLVALKGAWKEHPQIARVTWVILGGRTLTGIYADAASALTEAAHVVLFDADDGACDGETILTSEPVRGAAAGTCLFTSGSTGEPKGVLISTDDLMGRMDAEVAWFGLTPDDRLLSILPFSFDVGLNQLMTALAVGAELVVVDSWLPADILGSVEQRGVTGISGVPSIWQDMINAGVRFDTRGRHASLRYITVSGGSLARPYLEQLPALAAGVQIFKTYGQTEAFRATSLRPEDFYRKTESVGTPFPGVRVYVVREDGTRCAPAEVGEVVHTGLGTMMGYLGGAAGDDGGGDGKRRKNPYLGPDDASAFAIFTGDMGYLDDEGYLFLRGRRDNLVKVRGNRVYPEEVTNQIVRIAGVRDATVISVPDGDGQNVLVAFLVPAPGAELAAGAVRRALGATLPGFMIPKEIVIVPQIPRGLSGKPDRGELLKAYPATGNPGDRLARQI